MSWSKKEDRWSLMGAFDHRLWVAILESKFKKPSEC